MTAVKYILLAWLYCVQSGFDSYTAETDFDYQFSNTITLKKQNTNNKMAHLTTIA